MNEPKDPRVPPAGVTPQGGMSQNAIAQMFREQELGRRAARRKIILNHSVLESEQLSPHDAEIDRRAKQNIAAGQARFEAEIKAMQPRESYWRRLWNAVLGR